MQGGGDARKVFRGEPHENPRCGNFFFFFCVVVVETTVSWFALFTGDLPGTPIAGRRVLRFCWGSGQHGLTVGIVDFILLGTFDHRILDLLHEGAELRMVHDVVLNLSCNNLDGPFSEII